MENHVGAIERDQTEGGAQHRDDPHDEQHAEDDGDALCEYAGRRQAPVGRDSLYPDNQMDQIMKDVRREYSQQTSFQEIDEHIGCIQG